MRFLSGFQAVTFLAFATFSAPTLAIGGVGIITELSITGGDFAVSQPGIGTCDPEPLSFSYHKCITAGTVNPIDTDDGLFEGPTLMTIQFFALPWTTFTAASATGAPPSTSGNPLEGTTTASTISLDLGSFYAQWNGYEFLQAPRDSTGNALSPVVTGSYDSVSGAFDIAWSTYIESPFGLPGYYHVNGIATAVPEASTYGMMIVGLGAIGGVLFRRRNKAHRS